MFLPKQGSYDIMSCHMNPHFSAQLLHDVTAEQRSVAQAQGLSEIGEPRRRARKRGNGLMLVCVARYALNASASLVWAGEKSGG